MNNNNNTLIKRWCQILHDQTLHSSWFICGLWWTSMIPIWTPWTTSSNCIICMKFNYISTYWKLAGPLGTGLYFCSYGYQLVMWAYVGICYWATHSSATKLFYIQQEAVIHKVKFLLCEAGSLPYINIPVGCPLIQRLKKAWRRPIVLLVWWSTKTTLLHPPNSPAMEQASQSFLEYSLPLGHIMHRPIILTYNTLIIIYIHMCVCMCIYIP